jgi:phage terminase large subunit-like protein
MPIADDDPSKPFKTELFPLYTYKDLLGADCYGGLEVGPSGEVTALALLFPGDIIKIKMTFIIAEESLKTNDFYRENRELMKVDPGNVVENEVAIEWISEEFQKYNLNSFCFPKPQENNSIVQGLIKMGYQGNPISQGMSGISNATEEWEKALRAGQIEHFGNPILKWMNSNCLAVRKEQGTRLEKNGKVLGIYACINAIAQWKSVDANGLGELGIVYI